jgi:rRNA maturation protein Nop10
MHVYTHSKVYDTCSLCGNKRDHPAHFKPVDPSPTGQVTVKGRPVYYADGSPVKASDLVTGEQMDLFPEFSFVKGEK